MGMVNERAYLVRDGQEQKRLESFQWHMGDIVPVQLQEYLLANGFFSAPASLSHHSNHEGGLYQHSEMVMLTLEDLTRRLELTWQRPESPKIIGMLHDVCKMEEYRKVDDGNGGYYYERNNDMMLLGHGQKSAIMVQSMMELTDEELMCICHHMGAFQGRETWESYKLSTQRYPNLLWVHAADVMASWVCNI